MFDYFFELLREQVRPERLGKWNPSTDDLAKIILWVNLEN